MSDRTRNKSTVRHVLRSRKSKGLSYVGKLSPRYYFRAAVRLVVQYLGWISNDFSEDITENVTTNVILAQRKKASDQDLTVKDRSILLIPLVLRSEEDRKFLVRLIKNIRAFKRYPEDIREALAAECIYQYVPAGRTIIRQGHKAEAMYYIVEGRLQIFKDSIDEETGETTQVEVGFLEPGDIFGEIALLHNVPRTATVVSKTAADLLLVPKYLFNEYLRYILLDEWDILRDALLNFNYFKGWTEEMMRECCILSKIIDYKSNEILLGDGMGMIHYVYFLLSGECRLIEHAQVEKVKIGKKTKYKLHDSGPEDNNPRQQIGRNKKLEIPDEDIPTLLLETASEGTDVDAQGKDESSAALDYIKLLSTNKTTNLTLDRISVITVTLQDVINEWHEITDVVEMLMIQPSVTSLKKYPKEVETVFMQICIFYRGACFGLGEQMKNRRIVSSLPSKCLLIPRYWLTQHNRANIWERVKIFMDSKYPNQKELLRKVSENRKWANYKRDYIKNILERGRKLPNNTKSYDVPYSIRVNDDILG